MPVKGVQMSEKIKFYNEGEHGGYAPMPELSPYSKISPERIKNPKFIYRKSYEFVIESKEVEAISNWLDVGCANGEFLYFLSSKNPNIKFTGLDITPEFIAVAQNLNSDRKNVEFQLQDIFDTSTKIQYDVVTCLGTFQIFPDPERILNTLIDRVSPNGRLVISARFNPHNISATITYKDDSTEAARNIWRCDFNIHSEHWINEILSKRSDVRHYCFQYPIMDTDIPKKPNAPHINMWTIKRPDYGFDITNGLKANFNPSFLIIEKF